MPLRPAHFPQPVVRVAPVLFQKIQQRALQRPGVPAGGQARGEAEMQRVDDLAIHVELALVDGGVADPDRGRALVAGQPGGLPLGQAALTGHAVHDLHVGRITGHRAAEPVPPGQGLGGVPGAQQGLQGEGRITQPAVAVVPVAHPADVFRQRAGRRRDDPAGGLVGERLQRDQGAEHRLPVLALVGAARGPVLPEPGGRRQQGGRVRTARLAPMRRRVAEHERQLVAGPDRERRPVGHVTPGQRHR